MDKLIDVRNALGLTEEETIISSHCNDRELSINIAISIERHKILLSYQNTTGTIVCYSGRG